MTIIYAERRLITNIRFFKSIRLLVKKIQRSAYTPHFVLGPYFLLAHDYPTNINANFVD